MQSRSERGRTKHARSERLRVSWPPVDGAASRQLASAALAIVALYLQLVATGLCTASLSLGAPGGFTICHSETAPSGPAQNDHAPAHQPQCPFCAVHCHAAMVSPPSIHVAGTPAVIAAPAATMVAVALPVARFPASPPPRGPPSNSENCA